MPGFIHRVYGVSIVPQFNHVTLQTLQLQSHRSIFILNKHHVLWKNVDAVNLFKTNTILQKGLQRLTTYTSNTNTF